MIDSKFFVKFYDPMVEPVERQIPRKCLAGLLLDGQHVHEGYAANVVRHDHSLGKSPVS